MSKKKRKLMSIEWEDSCSYGSGAWQSNEQSLKPAIIHSVGYIHRKSKNHIELAAHLSEFCTQGNMRIPKSAIRKIKKL